jgi:hypothetical protein
MIAGNSRTVKIQGHLNRMKHDTVEWEITLVESQVLGSPVEFASIGSHCFELHQPSRTVADAVTLFAYLL